MTGVDPDACKFALSKIEDGFVFEDFAQTFLAPVLGHSFLPVGGIKDKGIDGLSHMFSAEGNDKVIYQYSIEKDPEGKSDRTLRLLKENKIKFDRFTFVTNQELPGKDRVIEALLDKHKKPIQVYDLAVASG